jgi:phosphoribosylformimino-5-aminoimidazole carboxamide ribotide isomerase
MKPSHSLLTIALLTFSAAINADTQATSKPLDIVAALLEYYPFQYLYIADLNAIQKLGDINNSNFNVIQTIIQKFPHLKVWIDAGISNKSELSNWSRLNSNVILGSENFSNLESFLAVKKQLNAQHVLSLDFMPHGYQGPIELLDSTHSWPKDVIIMSLTNVGANQGVNSELLEKFKQYTANFNLYAAGGVRGIDDLNVLKRLGVHGALIATALHQKQLTYQQIESLSQ